MNWNFIQTDPVVLTTILSEALAVGTAFGLHMTQNQSIAIMALAAGFAALIARANVTPNAKANANVQAALYTPVPAAPQPANPAVAAAAAGPAPGA